MLKALILAITLIFSFSFSFSSMATAAPVSNYYYYYVPDTGLTYIYRLYYIGNNKVWVLVGVTY